ncbi:hypothetical protein GOV12_02705 [Candidatus Pacearchaeota archaeon]|nr:hypothetical protein [Candidatus Pacearchaeota archaeon]
MEYKKIKNKMEMENKISKNVYMIGEVVGEKNKRKKENEKVRKMECKNRVSKKVYTMNRIRIDVQKRDKKIEGEKLIGKKLENKNINCRREINNKFDLNIFKKSLLLVLVGLFMILIISANIIALGISPGRVTLDYDPQKNQDVKIKIINNEHKTMKVMITAIMEGEMDGKIKLPYEYIEFLPSEEEKTLDYKIKVEKDLPPGLHKGKIMAIEVPDSSEGATSVGATIAVASQIHIYVPCPGKCIEADLEILDLEQNSTATFIVPVKSRGDLGIGNLRALIDIYRLDGVKITSLETDTKGLASGERTELSAKWDIDVSSGYYLAKVTVFYDGEDYKLEKQFSIGEQMLSIENIMVNNFQLGAIAKLQILVENKWNKDLEEVFANLLVYNKDDQVMADIKSAQETVEAQSKKELIAYWDTVGVSVGEYDGKLIVKYDNKETDKNLRFDVKENSLDVFGVGYAVRPSGGGKKGFDITFILIVIVVILLLVNVGWFIFFKRFISKRNSKKNEGKKK